MKILDACCGSRMFWFDKENPDVTFMDIREYYEELDSGHIINVKPNIIGDFRNMPFSNNTFDHVVFDPPHLINVGDSSWLAKKYGKLDKENWKCDMSKGMCECMRVLKPNGTLILKWNENQIKLKELLQTIEPFSPLYGNKRNQTHWLMFNKQDFDKKRLIRRQAKISHITNNIYLIISQGVSE